MGEEIWDEPVRGETFPPHLLGLSGIGQLRLFLDGKAAPPPVSHLTGTYPTEVGVGSATFVMPITGWLQIPPGLMTAGGVAILADGPLAWAIQSGLPPATDAHDRPPPARPSRRPTFVFGSSAPRQATATR